MAVPEVFKKLQPHIDKILADSKLASTQVQVKGRTLTPQEAIGSPGRDDFPLQKGKEKLMQAVIDGYAGQAFTDMPGNFAGTLKEVLTLPPTNNHNRAVIVATLNAVLRKLGEIDNTIHCKDEGPRNCSQQLVDYIAQNYQQPRIAFIGLQPAMVEQLAKQFTIRVFDLDVDNIGKNKFGVVIEDGHCDLEEVVQWCDIMLVTGSTVVNGTIDPFLKITKPVIFFGTTIAAVAELLQLKRYCPASN